jgi:hypothetical protein
MGPVRTNGFDCLIALMLCLTVLIITSKYWW